MSKTKKKKLTPQQIADSDYPAVVIIHSDYFDDGDEDDDDKEQALANLVKWCEEHYPGYNVEVMRAHEEGQFRNAAFGFADVQYPPDSWFQDAWD